jgi:transketolase
MLNKNLELNQNFFNSTVDKRSTRDGYGDGIIQAAKNDSDIVVLCGDLTESTRLEKFSQEFPERFIEAGIAEQNMAGVGAGLAMSGKVPFITSFSSFSPGRNWEQIRVSICLSNTNVKIASTHAGLSAASDGPTAQALEDIAITRVLPNLTILHPIDYEQAINATTAAAKYKGPVYIRFSRESLPEITTQFTPFDIGKAQTLIEGEDVSIFTTGVITVNVLKAAKELKDKYKINAEVIAFPTIKPLDDMAIIKSAKKTKKVVTVEEHQVYGGFGSAVAEVLVQNLPIKTLILGVQDRFNGSGNYDELLDKNGLSAIKITKKVLEFLGEKK